jgi:hypothetical protein
MRRICTRVLHDKGGTEETEGIELIHTFLLIKCYTKYGGKCEEPC